MYPNVFVRFESMRSFKFGITRSGEHPLHRVPFEHTPMPFDVLYSSIFSFLTVSQNKLVRMSLAWGGIDHLRTPKMLHRGTVRDSLPFKQYFQP